MVAKKISSRNQEAILIQELIIEEDYCSDCIYHWCTERSKVTFCTMKSKGLFECRSCILKMMNQYETSQSELLPKKNFEKITA